MPESTVSVSSSPDGETEDCLHLPLEYQTRVFINTNGGISVHQIQFYGEHDFTQEHCVCLSPERARLVAKALAVCADQIDNEGD